MMNTFEGKALAFIPDGAVKAWATELKVGEDVVEGSIANAEAGMSATISGKRVKK
jgi:hypothetical protein